jgi:hypothetical protein
MFRFPDPVNEVSARVVAGGVATMALAFVLTGWWPIMVVVAYGFVARTLAGPRFSPLGLLATRVITPRLRVQARLVPGPPKRFAQGMGAALSTIALALLGIGEATLARLVAGALLAAAALESGLAICLGCIIFGWLMRTGLIPEAVCVACSDITMRQPVARD